ncbi:hypothetical protein OH492_26810 [Vibrio chagasii]|nr:hypothetical protein [Vibrio chagasii]
MILINGRIAYEKAEALNSDKVSNRYKILVLRAYSEVLLAEGNLNAALTVANQCLASTGIEKYTLQNGQCYLNRALAKIGLSKTKRYWTSPKATLPMFELVGSRSFGF